MKAKSGKQIIEISKDVETEVMSVHNLFWESYARRDIELRFSLCSEDITFIGSGLHERALNKTEYKNINKEGVKQYPDPFQIEFLWTNITMLSDNVACVESEVVWSQLINDEMFKELLRNTTLLKRDNSKWLVTHVHGSVPDYRLKDGDYMTNEQTIIRNRELERQVFERTQDLNKTLEELELKNRELEIEGALEKVRTIAMGMRQPADMLDVCKTISFQLQSLGVKEIRNVQTAIFYEQRGTYMNYEFYAKHDRTFITETVFTNNEIHNEFATKMLKGRGETFITHIKDDEVKDWIAYQKTTNVFIDKYLETASSLNYYWFSLGPVALGISTYVPLTEDEISLFKRFLKVFELAYQRYLDIEKAEAQAREAQIEASLERVRAVAMGMNKSDDLLSICEVSFKEFKKLGFDNIRNALIHIQYDNQKYFMDYDFSDLTGGAITKIEYGSHPIVEDYLKQIRSAKDAFYQGVIKEDQLEEWKDFRRNSGQIDDPRLDKATSLYYYFFSIGIGDIGISTLKSIDESQIKILKTFRNVFSLSYQRYIDITLAETQAREAKIEAALEKVRGRAMAMRSSEDLGATVNVFFKELKNLGFLPRRCGVAIIDEAQRSAYNMITTAGNIGDSFEITGDVNLDSHFVLTNMLLNWKVQQDYFLELDTKQMEEYYRILRPQVAVTNFNDVRQYGYYLHFKEGMFYVWMDKELQVNDLQIFRRFTQVIGLTYRRHLDLQKAETQAREARIEAALEKVRSRTMGMQKSEELKEVIQVVYEQFVQLKINVDHAGFVVDYKPKGDWHFWIADEQDIPSKITHPYFESVWANQFDEAKEKGLDFFTTNLNFEEKNKFYNELLSYVPGLPQASKDFYLSCPGLAATTVLFDNVSLYIENFSGIPYSDEENNTLIRFGKVFQQTYTRFLDLQKAEAQARESQIEASLEKVRSKAMAMHSSADLSKTIVAFYHELESLNIKPRRCGVGIVNKETRDVELSSMNSTQQGKSMEIIGRIKLAGHPVLSGVWENWMLQKEYRPVLRGKEINDYYNFLSPQIKYPDYSHDAVQYGYYFFFQEGGTYVWTEEELSEDILKIYRRFTSVLSLTYKRYKELKEAEAQAREAKIEASLERVRSKAMAMHGPNDLSETVGIFFKELRSLNVLPWRCGVGQINEETKTTFLTTTSNTINGESFEVSGTLQQEGHPVLDGIFEHWKMQKEYYPVLHGDDISKYYEIIKPQIAYPKYPLDAVQYGHFIFIKEGFVFAWTENKLSEEELGIFRRFASVLSLTYRRYLDLKYAEAQNKIIRAENERKTKELEDARQLQLAMLPRELPKISNLDIAVYMKTATEVGGDYYDFNVQENGVLNIGLGDATGHGLQAGTMITLMKGFFTSEVARFNPKKFLEHCNGMIRDIKLGRILMSFSHLRFENNGLLISSAGMPPIYYYHKKNNRTEEIIIQGLPLGAMGSASYKLVEKELNSGDTILLLTDGLPEQMNSHNVIFDYSRVLKYFDEIAENTPNDIINCLVQKADEWMDGQKQSDDITFVVMKVK